MTSIGPTDEIRIGVVGLGRGRTFAKDSDVFRTRLVAVCDVNEAKLKAFQEERPDVAGFTDFDEFIKFDMDAVVLTNFFHEHTPFAIKALRHGKHVMSETTAAKTLQEAVALCNEVESHDLTYMLAENYPYFATNQEMRRLYQQGVVGNVRYAEGEYTHPMQVEDAIRISPGASHWRNNMAPTYYCTHALAPLMYITDTVPVGVNGLVIQGGADETGASNGTKGGIRTSDPLAVTVCRMDNGAIFRLLLGGLGARRNYYRVHGFRGMLDNVDGDTVRVGRNDWELEPGEREHVEFKARFPSHEELATTAGHGGGDFWTVHAFVEAIRSKEQPYFDVYRAVSMSAVAILAWKSALEDGKPFQVPDFRSKEARRAVAEDDWSPWPEDHRDGQPWPSARGKIVPEPESLAWAEEIWEKSGYHGIASTSDRAL